MKARAAFFFFLYVVAANLPFWVATRSIGFLLTGVFNVELLVVGALSLFLRRGAAVVLLLAAMLMDIVRGIGLTYLLSPSEMLGSARFLYDAAPSRVWSITAVAMCLGLTCLLAANTQEGLSPRERAFTSLALLVLGLVCGSVDVATGHMQLSRQDRQLGTLRLTRTPIHSLVMAEIQHQTFRRKYSAGADASMPSASRVMARFDVTAVSVQKKVVVPNVVLILVESWGKPLAEELDAALVRPYADPRLAERYTVNRGVVPFNGPTVAGEARELCGSAMGFGLLKASKSQFSRCLPAEMKARGYHGVALHGFSARMFDREEWYGRMGFDETWFRDGLKGQGLPVCPGPFPGICDAAASGWIGDRLHREMDSPQFIYWVTLNSHLPVPIPNLVANPPSCGRDPATAESAAMCSWYQLVFNVHRSVSELAMRETTRPTVFLIVGDHAPPFASARSRSEFSDRVVPYVLLVPKAEGGDSEGVRAIAAVSRSPVVRKPHWKRGRLGGVSPAEG